jgi:hypothetical protein
LLVDFNGAFEQEVIIPGFLPFLLDHIDVGQVDE